MRPDRDKGLLVAWLGVARGLGLAVVAFVLLGADTDLLGLGLLSRLLARLDDLQLERVVLLVALGVTVNDTVLVTGA